MDRYEYMRMKLKYLPKHVQQQYNLRAHAKNGYVYLDIRWSITASPNQESYPTNTFNTSSTLIDIMN